MTPLPRQAAFASARRLGLGSIACLLLTGSLPAQSDAAAVDKLTEKPARSDAAIPDFSGVLAGVYTYGAGYDGKQTERRVKFSLQLKQEAGTARFTGLLDEEYTDFGTPKQGRLWARVVGEFIREKGDLKIRFQKTYLDHEQPALSYSGIFDPERRSFDGYWTFPTGQRGSFTLQLPRTE